MSLLRGWPRESTPFSTLFYPLSAVSRVIGSYLIYPIESSSDKIGIGEASGLRGFSGGA
jgi:hypothetical protein